MGKIKERLGFLVGLKERVIGFFESIKKLRVKPGCAHEERSEEILEKIGINNSDEEFMDLKQDLIGILANQGEDEKLLDWFERIGNLLRRKVDNYISKEKRVLKKKHEKERRNLIIPTIQGAFERDILTIENKDAVEILKCLKQKKDFQTLKERLDFDSGNIKNGVDWLETLGMIERNRDKSSAGEVYSVSGFGYEVLEENSGHNQEPRRDEQLCSFARDATRNSEDAEKMLNRLFGRWGGNHRGVFEKLNKEFGKPLEKMSKCFWKKIGDESHEKHIGIKISNHEAAGALMCLRLADMHLGERISKDGGPAGTRGLGRCRPGGKTVATA